MDKDNIMLSLGHLLFHKKPGAFLMVLCKYGKGIQSLTYDQTFKKGSKLIRGWIISIRQVNGLTLQKLRKINRRYEVTYKLKCELYIMNM